MPNIPQQWVDHLAGEDPRLTERPELRDAVVKAMWELADLLTFPQDHHGNTIDLTYILAPIAYHLALGGARVHHDEALIKSRPVPGQGVIEGAVEWVGMDSPDVQPLPAEPPTLADLAQMSPAEQAAALQAHGITATPDPNAGWHTKTRITEES